MEDEEMPQSTDRILTTHAGSLPMPADLHAMLRAKEAGQPYDAPDTRRGGGSAAAGGARARHHLGWRAIEDELHHLRERASGGYRDRARNGKDPRSKLRGF